MELYITYVYVDTQTFIKVNSSKSIRLFQLDFRGRHTALNYERQQLRFGKILPPSDVGLDLVHSCPRWQQQQSAAIDVIAVLSSLNTPASSSSSSTVYITRTLLLDSSRADPTTHPPLAFSFIKE